jgi:uncharacterized protein (AIM24 family)
MRARRRRDAGRGRDRGEADPLPGMPRLLPTSVADGSFAGVTYRVAGELVPVLTVEVTPEEPVYFEHHVILWKHPQLRVGVRPMRGVLRRMVAGMRVFVTETKGAGQIAFSRDGAGHIVTLHLADGEEVQVREHQFLAATRRVDYAFERVRGVATVLLGGAGFFVDRFHARGGDGIVWLHGYGNVFEKRLEPGEAIDVEPGGWLYKDRSVRMTTGVQRLRTGLFAGMRLVTNRFTGPGRVGIQSMYVHVPAGA